MAKPKQKAERASTRTVKLTKAQKKIRASVDEAKAYLMQCNLTANVPDVNLSLDELEKKFDLAGARLTYAMEQKDYWNHEAFRRSQDFNRMCTAFKSRKHGFTDEEVRENPKVSTAGWSYAI